jgi:hypothetical protein
VDAIIGKKEKKEKGSIHYTYKLINVCVMNHLIFVCKTEKSWGNYQIGFLFVNRDFVVIISPVSPICELIVSSNTKKA